MGTIIMRESRESDFYVGWNTTADGISFHGTRDEAIEYLWFWVVNVRDRDEIQPEDRRHPENVMQRCDILGTTSYFQYQEHPLSGGWDDTGFVYEQIGWVTRENLFKIARRMHEADSTSVDVSDLLAPLDDDA